MQADRQREVELARRFISGDDAAFEELAVVFRPLLMQHSRLTEGFGDTEDLVQGAFVELWRNRKRFRQPNNIRDWVWTSWFQSYRGYVAEFGKCLDAPATGCPVCTGPHWQRVPLRRGLPDGGRWWREESNRIEVYQVVHATLRCLPVRWDASVTRWCDENWADLSGLPAEQIATRARNAFRWQLRHDIISLEEWVRQRYPRGYESQ